MGRYRRRGYGYSYLASRKRSSRRRSIPMAEQGSFWETLMVGTGEGPQAERKEKVLRYVIHRLKGEASLREVLQEEYVRRNCDQLEIEEILLDPELVHAARGHMEQSFRSGELDPIGDRRSSVPSSL
jgi:hypothetical protein